MNGTFFTVFFVAILGLLGNSLGCSDATDSSDVVHAGDTGDVSAPDTDSTLNIVADPRDVGCSVTPTQVHPWYGGGANFDICTFETIEAISDAMKGPPAELSGAVGGAPLPSDCLVSGSAVTIGLGDVPAGCAFSFVAVIGTLSPEHQVVEYKVVIQESEGCWKESCVAVVRHDHRPSLIER